ncbi:alpha/beta hydrolase family protein [Paenibacillus ginsengarvi]|uniref:S9 family peptidase n=1 Tax=Paenibacillus ginsengarvi TaxID=400777 RepID=A0A3B0CML2_9BACL|nr:prolyl oligopeptidase family serine peptidase [Paenibacillus ginsengarvi]RKN85196.1 S9 family peptidase [Paenibacillus ginsengarvi]
MDLEAGRDGTLVQREPLPDPVPGIRLECITYWSQGLRVKGYYCAPETEKPLPPLVYCRGGIRSVGMVRVARLVTLARRGYAVFAPFYRGNEGGEGREDFGGEDRHDLYNGIRLLRSLPGVRDEPVPLLGFSRGAMMALLASKECEGVGPVAVWGGVSDLLLTYEERVDLRRMLKRVVGHPKKDETSYRARSPVCWAGQIASPVLIIHGSIDEHVGVEHAYRLGKALAEAGKSYKMDIYQGRAHVFPREEDEAVLDSIFDWFSRA